MRMVEFVLLHRDIDDSTQLLLRKAEAPHPGALVPYDCCALSLQPFEHPVLARNKDGTGTVFDLLNIIPWLK